MFLKCQARINVIALRLNPKRIEYENWSLCGIAI